MTIVPGMLNTFILICYRYNSESPGAEGERRRIPAASFALLKEICRMILRIVLLTVALLLLAAHFLRAGILVLTVACLLAPLLLLMRRRWALLLVQFLVYFGAGVWTYTAIHLVQERTMLGRPWSVAAIILGTVTLFTILAGLLLNSRAIKDKYPPRQRLVDKA
jgi:hypothetical protein